MSLVRFEWTPLFFTNRAFHRSFLEKSGIFRCHAINFNTTMSPRQEVKDGHSLHRSIHSYGRFDRFQSAKVWVHRRRSLFDALDNAAPRDFLTPVSFLLPAALFEIHFYQLGGAGGSKFGIYFLIESRRNA